MRIGIDARMMGSKQSGLGRYIEQLIFGLEKIDSKNDYLIFLRKDNFNDYTPSNSHFIKVLADIPWYSWREQFELTKIIEKENVDLMHFPHWNVPLFYHHPFVVTIHDLIMYHHPRPEASTHGRIVYKLKDFLHRLVLRNAIDRAIHIITTSEFTKNDIYKNFDNSLDKMTVIYQAPFQISNQTQNEKILEKFGISKKYVLYVGSAYPHKNLQGLLKAWKIFEDRYGEEYQLVLCGKNNYFYQRLKSHALGLKSVIFTGYVSDLELSKLYSTASLYVFPSLYEGFGLPPLEAMAYRIPIVSSNSSCLPEILGEAALYFDPTNYEQMAEIIHTALTDKNIRMELIGKEVEELKRYSWLELAKKINYIYNKYNV